MKLVENKDIYEASAGILGKKVRVISVEALSLVYVDGEKFGVLTDDARSVKNNSLSALISVHSRLMYMGSRKCDEGFGEFMKRVSASN